MSALLNTTTGTINYTLGMPGVKGNDDSIQPEYYRFSAPRSRAKFEVIYSDVLWPRSRMTFPDIASTPQLFSNAEVMYAMDRSPVGGHRRKRIDGQVLDSGGSPVSGAEVRIFNTSTGYAYDVTTSDSGGNYQLTEPNNVASFVVADKSGSPDTAGTTVQTLTGT
jgi:hypothetical protein